MAKKNDDQRAAMIRGASVLVSLLGIVGVALGAVWLAAMGSPEESS